MTAYMPAYSAVAQELKYNYKSQIAFELAQLMADAIFDSDMYFDAVTEVPMSKSEVLKRGHNQARTLAVYLGQIFNIPHIESPLLRSENSLVQHSLPRDQRFQNAEASFHLSETAAKTSGRILLVDDICTTGATLNRCSKLLMQNGASSVLCATAFTVLRHQ